MRISAEQLSPLFKLLAEDGWEVIDVLGSEPAPVGFIVGTGNQVQAASHKFAAGANESPDGKSNIQVKVTSTTGKFSASGWLDPATLLTAAQVEEFEED
jgi:hypothetical protein